MPTVITDTGRVALRKGSAKTMVWHCPRRGGAGGEREVVLFAAAKDPRNTAVQSVSGWSAPRSSLMDLIPGQQPRPVAPDIGGSMQAATYEIADGEVIKVFAQVNAPYNASANPAALRAHISPAGVTAQQFYRVRQGAAVVTLKVKMLDDPRCPYRHSTITGPLEPLTLEEAVALGVKAPDPQFRKCYHQALTDFLISTETLQRASTTLQTVQTAEGPKQIVQAAERVRNVRKGPNPFVMPKP